jgi:glyoxylase-like metal-dependent hydrolase (beta-lactamase superfamily II)
MMSAIVCSIAEIQSRIALTHMALFRQLHDPESSTLTYLLADPNTWAAALIDPVPAQQSLYLTWLAQHGLKLKYVLLTHSPQEHSAEYAALCAETGARLAAHDSASVENCDQRLRDGDRLYVGEEMIEVIHIPGPLACSVTYRWNDRLFTGQSLWINEAGCFHNGRHSLVSHYDSVNERLFSLPDEYLVYPGYDHSGHRVSCISQQKLACQSPDIAESSKLDTAM